MKMYLNSEQTAKLIELGFKPIARIKEVQTIHSKVAVYHDCDFTIGELLSFLPKSIKVNDCYFTLTISAEFDNWLVEYLKQKQQYIITLANDYYSKRLIHKRAYDGMLKYALENLV